MTILQPNDAQPYPLSIVKPGQTMRSLENNLIRAPVFEHQPEPTDFLVVRYVKFLLFLDIVTLSHTL